MMRWLVGLFLMGYAAVCADVFDHLKPALNKAEGHSLENIDFIYMINLDQRPEKWEMSVQKLFQYGIVPYRFSAVNGWELSAQVVQDVGVEFRPWMARDFWGTYYPDETTWEAQHEMLGEAGKSYFSHCMSRGAIGIVLSHVSVIMDAYQSRYETIWVMEDDIDVVQDPRIMCDLIEKLDALVGSDGWDILFTDVDTKNGNGEYVPCMAYARRPDFIPSDPRQFVQQSEMSSDFRWIGARYGAYSMIVRRSGMQKILDFFCRYPIFLPYDMELPTIPDIRLFTVRSDVVSTTPMAPSDNGGPFYLAK